MTKLGNYFLHKYLKFYNQNQGKIKEKQQSQICLIITILIRFKAQTHFNITQA